MIKNAQVDVIRSWPRDREWYAAPTRERIKLGDGVTIGDRVTIGDGARIGDGVTIRDGATSLQLAQQIRDTYKSQPDWLFTKWVTRDRMSPNFDEGTPVKYETGATVEAEGEANDQQCAPGLHVLRFGYRPEWAGLCSAEHALIPLRVRVKSEDILFAGLPGNDTKFRVRRLEVLD